MVFFVVVSTYALEDIYLRVYLSILDLVALHFLILYFLLM
jgi:hypothetical protein